MLRTILGLVVFATVSSSALAVDVKLPTLSEARLGWRLHCVGARTGVILQWQQDESYSSPGGFTLANSSTWAVAGLDQRVVMKDVGFSEFSEGRITVTNGSMTFHVDYENDLLTDLVCSENTSKVRITVVGGGAVSENASCTPEITAMMDLRCAELAE